MTETNNTDWRMECQRLDLDPHEVKKVSSRYDMYKGYTEKETGEYLPLDRWYQWYRVEKLSEGHATRTPPVEGCSVGPETNSEEPVVSGSEFLSLLKLYRQI